MNFLHDCVYVSSYYSHIFLFNYKSVIRGGFCRVKMDLELKRVQEARRNDCKKVMNYINSVDFTSLDDKEIRTMVMIRELGNGIANRQTKLVRKVLHLKLDFSFHCLG